MTALTRFCLIRHGETTWNQESRMQGHLDIPLNDNGIAQAQTLAESLQGQVFDALYSSDLVRAERTAAVLAQRLGLSVIPLAALRERNLGVLQGLTHAEAAQQQPTALAGYQKNLDFEVAGGESTRQFIVRCVTTLEDLAQHHVGKTLLIVTHGGVLAGWLKHILGIPLDQPRRFKVPNTSLNWFRHTADGPEAGWWLESWGNTGHLQQMRSLDDT